MRRLSCETYLSYGWTLRTKFLECFPGTSVCGPYFWAPLPCWALATHNDMIHMITNDIIIKAKINAPKNNLRTFQGQRIFKISNFKKMAFHDMKKACFTIYYFILRPKIHIFDCEIAFEDQKCNSKSPFSLNF